MIGLNFYRLGTLVMNAIIERLSQPEYLVSFRKLMAEFESKAPETMYFRSGRAKLQDTFPNIGFEITSRKDTWAAISFTKDIELRFDIYVAIKVLATPRGTPLGQISELENYVIALSEFVHEILNEPLDALQYTVTKDQDGNDLPFALKIYDSMSEGIQYGFLYNGALRFGKISWFGKIMRVGTSGGQLGYGELAARGDWVNTTTYAVNDLVTYLGEIFQSLHDGNLGSTPTEGIWWTKLS